MKAQLFLLLLLLTIPALADAPLSADDLSAVRFDQLLGQHVPLDDRFLDETGKPVLLKSYLGSQPAILVPGYYRCPMMCPLVTDGIIQALQDVQATAGRDFQVIYFSINPKESLADAMGKKKLALRQYGRDAAANGWHFLIGSEKSDRQLADAIGFHYAYDPQSHEYAHASGFVVLTPDGTISRYFFGVNYSPRDLRLALDEGSGDKIGSPTERLFLLCFHYNPLTGKYSLAILNFIRLCGAATLVALGAFIAFSIRRERLLQAGGV